MKIAEETKHGVMVMKDGKGWGTVYSDGQCTCMGWVDPIKAGVHDPRYCKKPTSATYAGSPDEKNLKQGRLVKVRVVTSVFIEEEA
jgi:hypothetical protein